MKTTRFPQTVGGVVERMTGFMHHLRDNGLPVSVIESQFILNALPTIDISNSHHVRLACKTICSTSHDSYTRFDDLFDSYWFNRGKENRKAQSSQVANRKPQQHTFQPDVGPSDNHASGNAIQPDSGKGQGKDEDFHQGEGKLIASESSNLEKTDFRELMTNESLKKAEQLAATLAKAIRDRRSRRLRSDKDGKRINLRKTIRASIGCGGTLFRLFHMKKPDRPVHIVALLDVSGSMTVYSRIFLAFIKGLVSHDTKTDAFLFHTALIKISDTLRDSDTLRAVNRLSIMAQGFGGGTRIAANLKRFNDQYAKNTVNGRTVVIILSDSYDTDSPDALSNELKRLKKRNCKIIWLNPLKGWKDYQPIATGMAAALPWLDHFSAANTLESLATLEPQLARM